MEATPAAANGARLSVDDLLERMVACGASDLHVTTGSEPAVRLNGRLERLEDCGPLTPDDTQQLLYRIMSTSSRSCSRSSARSTSRTRLRASPASA